MTSTVWHKLRTRLQMNRYENETAVPSPFWIIVQKEFSDHLRSWRFVILLGIVSLACFGSIYASVQALRNGAVESDSQFLFLQMFIASDGTLPSFVTFVSFLGPLMGISLGFDAINSERMKGTLSRMLSQPVYRDDFIQAKFTAALLLTTTVMFSLGFMVMGLGLFTIGFPPTPEELLRVLCFLLVAIVYVGFWLCVSMLFSIRFRQAATSALSGIAIWIFYSVFYGMIVNIVSNATAPENTASTAAIIRHQQWLLTISRFSPAELFSEATSTLLMPSIRSLGPLTVDQVYGAIPAPLPLGQSLLLVWPQLTGLIAATLVCYGIAYAMFMRQEIRSRS
ncbi:ABC transporter permease [Paenibacillus tarimensis]